MRAPRGVARCGSPLGRSASVLTRGAAGGTVAGSHRLRDSASRCGTAAIDPEDCIERARLALAHVGRDACITGVGARRFVSLCASAENALKRSRGRARFVLLCASAEHAVKRSRGRARFASLCVSAENAVKRSRSRGRARFVLLCTSAENALKRSRGRARFASLCGSTENALKRSRGRARCASLCVSTENALTRSRGRGCAEVRLLLRIGRECVEAQAPSRGGSSLCVSAENAVKRSRSRGRAEVGSAFACRPRCVYRGRGRTEVRLASAVSSGTRRTDRAGARAEVREIATWPVTGARPHDLRETGHRAHSARSSEASLPPLTVPDPRAGSPFSDFYVFDRNRRR
jgi:hypothetical protein